MFAQSEHTLSRRYVNHDVVAQAAVEVLFPTVATIAVIFRFWIRRRYKISWSWDDALIALSLVFTWGYTGVWLWVCTNLIGTRADALLPTTPNLLTKLCVAMDVLYGEGTNVVKFAILFLYLRAFGSERKVRIGIYVLFGIVGAFTIARAVETAYVCIPICLGVSRETFSVPAFCVAMRAVNWVTEVMILSFPIPILWKMTALSTKKKIGLSIVFFLGIVTCAASAVRLYLVLLQYFNNQTQGTGVAWYFDYYIPQMSKMAVCGMAELNIGILTATLPAIQTPATSFFKSTFDRILNHSKTSSKAEECDTCSPEQKSLATTTTTTTTKSFAKELEYCEDSLA